MSKEEQVDTFARMKCPNCNKEIDIEVLINAFGRKLKDE